MTISSKADYAAAFKQTIECWKTNAHANGNPSPISQFGFVGGAGTPAGTVSAGNTTNGVVPDDTVTGYPSIASFGGGTGYITKVELNVSPLTAGIPTTAGMGRFRVYDRLFAIGALTFGASVTLSSQPDFSGRVPGGDYKGLQLWLECVVALTGSGIVTVSYTNENGVSGRTATANTFGLAVGAMQQFPLQAGDQGIQSIDSVSDASFTAGTYNVCILRLVLNLLMQGSVNGAMLQPPPIFDGLKTGLPIIYDDSALFVTAASNNLSTSSTYSMMIEIASK